MSHMGLLKWKASNAGKILVSESEVMKQQLLADMAAEATMNEIPHHLVINWNQTGLRIIPNCDWTMHLSGEKIVPIAACDDQEEIMAVLAAKSLGCISSHNYYTKEQQKGVIPL